MSLVSLSRVVAVLAASIDSSRPRASSRPVICDANGVSAGGFAHPLLFASQQPELVVEPRAKQRVVDAAFDAERIEVHAGEILLPVLVELGESGVALRRILGVVAAEQRGSIEVVTLDERRQLADESGRRWDIRHLASHRGDGATRNRTTSSRALRMRQRIPERSRRELAADDADDADSVLAAVARAQPTSRSRRREAPNTSESSERMSPHSPQERLTCRTLSLRSSADSSAGLRDRESNLRHLCHLR